MSAMAMVLIPTVSLIVWLDQHSFEQEVREAEVKHLLLARNVTFALSRYVRDLRAVFLHAVIDAGKHLHEDQDSTLAEIQVLENLKLKSVVRISADANFLARQPSSDKSSVPEIGAEIREAVLPLVEDSKNRPGHVFFSNVVARPNSEPSIYLLMRDENSKIYLGELATSYIVELQSSIAFGELGHAAIVDRMGTIIAHPNEQWRRDGKDISTVSIVQEIMKSKTGVTQFFSPAKKVDMIAGFTTVPETGWGVMVSRPVSELRAASRINLATQISVVIFALIAASLLGWWLSGLIANPVQSVAAAARNYKKDSGQGIMEVPASGAPAELKDLVTSFNALIQEVEAQKTRLEERVVERTEELETQIAERKLAEDQLREKQLQLNQVTRLSTMGEMATGLAHELNQPLAAIAAYVDGSLHRLQSGEAPSEQIFSALEKASQQASRAGEIIRRIRDFIQNVEGDQEIVDVNHAVREAIELMENELRSQAIQLEIDYGDGIPPIRGDTVQLQQLIINLARNSIEAMSEAKSNGHRLYIQTKCDDDGLVNISVEDNGPGVVGAIGEKAFDPFFTTKENGLGMGLAICRSIAEVHNGQLYYETPSSGGARFKCAFPGWKGTGDGV